MEFKLHILSRQDVHVPIGTDDIVRVVFDLRRRVVRSEVSKDLASILLHMDQQLSSLLESFYHQHAVQPEDRIGLKLTFEGESTVLLGRR